MGEIHELFVLALSLVWFAGATPDYSEVLFWPHKAVSKNSLQVLGWYRRYCFAVSSEG